MKIFGLRLFERPDPMFSERAEDNVHFTFWRDGVHSVTKNACLALRLAGEKAALENIARFVDTAPRRSDQVIDHKWQAKSYCYEVLSRALKNHPAEAEPVVEYFIRYYSDRPWRVQDMMSSTLYGLLRAFEEDVARPEIRSTPTTVDTTEGAS